MTDHAAAAQGLLDWLTDRAEKLADEGYPNGAAGHRAWAEAVETLINERAGRQRALDVATRYGQIDGGHHKAWVIDQMVREFTGCPSVRLTANDHRGEPYAFDGLGESPEYLELIRNYRGGEDGPATYDWDEGIAP